MQEQTEITNHQGLRNVYFLVNNWRLFSEGNDNHIFTISCLIISID